MANNDIPQQNETSSDVSLQSNNDENKAIKTKYFSVLSTTIFSIIVLVFAFFALIGIVSYSYSHDVQFTEGSYIAIIILILISIIALIVSLVFLSKLKKQYQAMHDNRSER